MSRLHQTQPSTELIYSHFPLFCISGCPKPMTKFLFCHQGKISWWIKRTSCEAVNSHFFLNRLAQPLLTGPRGPFLGAHRKGHKSTCYFCYCSSQVSCPSERHCLNRPPLARGGWREDAEKPAVGGGISVPVGASNSSVPSGSAASGRCSSSVD